jgi:hypothetical protein
MLGGVISFLICIWFYLTADRLKLNPLQWVAGALIVFYGTKAIWTFLILKPLMGAGYTHHGMLGGLMMELAGALLGALACWLFRARVMLKQAR